MPVSARKKGFPLRTREIGRQKCDKDAAQKKQEIFVHSYRSFLSLMRIPKEKKGPRIVDGPSVLVIA